MNTPSHAIINLALLGKRTYVLSALLGGVVPDLPIFMFFLFQKLIQNQSGQAIWGEIYFSDKWQAILAPFHSIPFAIMLVALAVGFRKHAWTVFGLSLIMHSALDFPFHHADAHMHFFPFSDYRFRSPLSYWDPAHHAKWVGLFEYASVALSSYFIWKRHKKPWARIALAVLVTSLGIGFLYGILIWG